MKRGIGILLLSIAGAILLLPGVIGMAAEREHRELVTALAASDPDVSVERYERGWFESRSVLRVPLDLERYPGPAGGDSPRRGELVVESRIHHGPWPRFPRRTASYRPVTAQARSTVTVRGDDDSWQLPGAFYSTLGPSGAGRVRYQAEAQRLPLDDTRVLEWEGADLTFDFDPGNGRFTGRGHIGRLWSDEPGEVFVAGPVDVESDQRRTPAGLWVGRNVIEIAEIRARTDEESIELQQIVFVYALEQHDQQARITLDGSVQRMAGQTWGGGDAVVRLQIEKLDAAALGDLMQQMDARSGGSAGALSTADESLMRLVWGGAHINMSELRVPTPDGLVRASLELSSPRHRAGTPLPLLLATLEGRLLLEVPRGLAHAAVSTDETLAHVFHNMLQLGMLESTGAAYTTDARYRNGRLEVNGLVLSGFPGT